MGKASSSKKVARAARTGGGRTRRGGSSWIWPTFLTVVVVLGLAVIVFSKSEQTADASPPQRGDHWHSALGINVCGQWLAPITDQNDPAGIHTHGDGVVHIHPNSETAAGDRATLGKYFEAVNATVNTSEISIPGQPSTKVGDKCGDQDAELRTKIWSSRDPDARERVVTGDPSDIRFTDDGELITIFYGPGDAEIPKPDSADQLDKLTDVGPNSSLPPGVSLPPDVSLPPGVSLPPDATADPVPVDPNATTPAPADPNATAPPASAPAP